MKKQSDATKAICKVSFPTTPELTLIFYLESLDAQTAGPGRYITEIDDLVGGQIILNGISKPVFIGETLGFIMGMWSSILAASLQRVPTTVGISTFSIRFIPNATGMEVEYTKNGSTLHSEHFEGKRMADWVHTSCLDISSAIAKQLDVVALPPTLDAHMLLIQACSRKR